MVAPEISFLTPYWSGAEMMRRHVSSIRKFHPRAPILISKRGDANQIQPEMERLQDEFDVRSWIEDCGYTDAYLRLLQRCTSRFVCIIDHDAVLLSSIEPLIARIASNETDLVGVEERIRVPDRMAGGPWPEGWLRCAPGRMASNFLIFDWQAFASRWGLRGIFGRPDSRARHFDFDYGISQRLRRHYYLRPYHAPRYGLGNLLKDGDVPVVWHQWYGSYRTRFTIEPVNPELVSIAQEGETAFLADYPNLMLEELVAAWGPDCDTGRSSPGPMSALARVRQEIGYSLRALAARVVVGLERATRGASPE